MISLVQIMGYRLGEENLLLDLGNQEVGWVLKIYYKI